MSGQRRCQRQWKWWPEASQWACLAHTPCADGMSGTLQWRHSNLERHVDAGTADPTRGGTAAVIKHKWFSTFDWQGLEKMDMKPPYKPAVVSKDDIANFDVFDEGEDPAVSDWSPDLANL